MKGILFTAESIQAIIEGRKTQTRRVIKHPAVPNGDIVSFQEFVNVPECNDHWTPNAGYYALLRCNANQDFSTTYFRCPYHIGETVYIKEAHYRYGYWAKNGLTKTGRQMWSFRPLLELFTRGYSSVEDTLRYCDSPPDEVKPNSYRKEGWYKRSPLFLPEVFARHFIVIEQVRAERVQEISRNDVEAEGCSNAVNNDVFFPTLWDTINPKYPWESNCWVFPYTFRLKGGE